MLVVETMFKNNARIKTTTTTYEDFLQIEEILEQCIGGLTIGVIPTTWKDKNCSCVIYKFLINDATYTLHYMILDI